MIKNAIFTGALMTSILTSPTLSQGLEDPYLWLEEVQGERALNWVEDQNKVSTNRLEKDARFDALKESALRDYNADDKIAYGTLLAGFVHNFWQDADNVRGLWRRATLASYAAGEPDWETLLDLDALSDAEGENWVMKARRCLAPSFDRCLIDLSRGGGDAVVTREYDLMLKRFVDNGFITSEAKQQVEWVDRDTVLIGTDFGAGTLTDSGYANQVKIWKRGFPLETAKLLHTGNISDVLSLPFSSHRADGSYAGVIQMPDFFTQILHILDDSGEEMQPLDLPRTIDFKGIFAHDLILQLRRDWTISGKTAVAGSLVSVNIGDAIGGSAGNNMKIIYAPNSNASIDSVSIGKDRIFIALLEDVTGTLLSATPSNTGWQVQDLNMPENGAINLVSADDWEDALFVNFESFLQPDSLYLLAGNNPPKSIYSLPDRFDASSLVTEQKFAVSQDGTKVPYFVIRRADTPLTGATPTILYGYGGFEISMTPAYLTGVAKLWLENGGAYVVANIRGGGEYGPSWHQAALKENRQRAYDDFIAVSEALINSGLTSSDRLAVRGGSNGGLLVGAMYTQRPDLFGAVICAVPLLDMMRYHTLLAGASWMGEYGNPDIPEERAYIAEYSPYQNVSSDTDYPDIFIFTSTKDDRVHPGHARKMAARLMEYGKPVTYYENTEGGHAAAANLVQRAYTDALQVVYALQTIKDKNAKEK